MMFPSAGNPSYSQRHSCETHSFKQILLYKILTGSLVSDKFLKVQKGKINRFVFNIQLQLDKEKCSHIFYIFQSKAIFIRFHLVTDFIKLYSKFGMV